MSVKVAVYGTLRRGEGNNGWFEGKENHLGDHWVDGFEMYDYGPFPYVIKGNGKVKVEIYEVPEEIFKSLDILEGYPSFYNRIQVDINHHEGVWIYIHDDYTSGHRIEVGDWLEQHNV